MAEARWIVDDFSAALAQLQSALAVPVELDLIKEGSIQYFEFCFELAWKPCKVVTAEQGLPDCLSPKACLRQAFTLGWIEEEAIWLEMLDARNALKIYESLPRFLTALHQPLATLQAVTRH